MKVDAIKTHTIQMGESIPAILDQYISHLEEGTVIAITSKIISVSQGRMVDTSSVTHKYDLVKKEADAYLREEENLYEAYLTLKNHILIPSAGIDESNSNGQYILYPLRIQETAREIWQHLREKFKVESVGIIITDSHTTPLRKGVTGICLGWCGFEPLYSYVGKPDIFNKPLQVTQMNLLDALATASVLVMGEGNEQTPLALIQDIPKIAFLDQPPTKEEENQIHISLEEDIYSPILKKADWIWNRR